MIEQVSPERPVSLFGHGWGGMLAAAYAGKTPEKIDQLILAEPGFLNTDMANRILPALFAHLSWFYLEYHFGLV